MAKSGLRQFSIAAACLFILCLWIVNLQMAYSHLKSENERVLSLAAAVSNSSKDGINGFHFPPFVDYWKGHVYKLMPPDVFANANSYCKAWDGALASVHSEAENKFLVSMVHPFMSSCVKVSNDDDDAECALFFIGLQNTPQMPLAWTDGSHLGYTHWDPASGRPERNEDALIALNAEDGTWKSIHDPRQLPFICKKSLIAPSLQPQHPLAHGPQGYEHPNGPRSGPEAVHAIPGEMHRQIKDPRIDPGTGGFHNNFVPGAHPGAALPHENMNNQNTGILHHRLPQNNLHDANLEPEIAAHENVKHPMRARDKLPHANINEAEDLRDWRTQKDVQGAAVAEQARAAEKAMTTEKGLAAEKIGGGQAVNDENAARRTKLIEERAALLREQHELQGKARADEEKNKLQYAAFADAMKRERLREEKAKENMHGGLFDALAETAKQRAKENALGGRAHANMVNDEDTANHGGNVAHPAIGTKMQGAAGGAAAPVGNQAAALNAERAGKLDAQQPAAPEANAVKDLKPIRAPVLDANRDLEARAAAEQHVPDAQAKQQGHGKPKRPEEQPEAEDRNAVA